MPNLAFYLVEVTIWLIKARGSTKLKQPVFSWFLLLLKCIWVQKSSQHCRIFKKWYQRKALCLNHKKIRTFFFLKLAKKQRSDQKKVVCFGHSFSNIHFLLYCFFIELSVNFCVFLQKLLETLFLIRNWMSIFSSTLN